MSQWSFGRLPWRQAAPDRKLARSASTLPVSKILVPVNGNPSDDEAVELACRVATARSQIYLVHVIEVNWTLPLGAEIQPEVEKANAVLDRAEGKAAEADHAAQSEILQARDVGTAIVEFAQEQAVELIILGITYKQRFGQFDLGRTAPFILKNAPCRVWLCRQKVAQN